MRILRKDFGKGFVQLRVDSLDDLWYLSQIIDIGDKVSGKTERKLKLGEAGERTKTVTKVLWLKIDVEKVDFSRFSNQLRVSGKVIETREEAVPLGSYHSIEFEEGTVASIEKASWPIYQRKRLQDAVESGGENILLIVMDREEATIAHLTQAGYELLTELRGEVGKKGYDTQKGKDFYTELSQLLQEYQKRLGAQAIIIASPAFWKEDFLAILKKKDAALTTKVHLASCNDTGRTGVEEILKRQELKDVLKKDRTTKETTLVDAVFAEIGKQGAAAYGWDEVNTAVESGAVKVLLVTDAFFHRAREEGRFAALDTLMKNVDAAKGDVHIVSTEHEAGKRLDGIGGIAALLRYILR